MAANHDDNEQVRESVGQQYNDAAENVVRSVRVWNELLTASTDMAFDVVLKNWDYSRSLRGSTEQAIEDAIKTQQRLSKEMMQMWQGYSENVRDIVEKKGE